MPTGSQRQTGFTYIGLLLAVAFFGVGSVGAARLLASTERIEREAELLFVGHQFRQAIGSYMQSGPVVGQYPPTLEDLVLDKRHPTPRRHLRKVFLDPITGKPEWGLIAAPQGGIMGVHSLSDREPLKRANFEAQDGDFAIKAQQPQATAKAAVLQPLPAAATATPLTPLAQTPYSYRDWKFVRRPATSGGFSRPAESGGG